MSIKLHALELGLGLAFGATGAMAQVSATIEQRGEDNTSYITQDSVQNTRAGITVEGSWGNNATINQVNVSNSQAWVSQSASGGDVVINQGGAAGGSWNNTQHRNLTASVTQHWGWGNEAEITQLGRDATATVNQSGSWNTVAINQNATGRNGGNLVATVTQFLSYGSDAEIIQSGRNLTAHISQQGWNNEATIRQTGSRPSGYTASITQWGDRNVASITQR